jgi:hypothetical protein
MPEKRDRKHYTFCRRFFREQRRQRILNYVILISLEVYIYGLYVSYKRYPFQVGGVMGRNFFYWPKKIINVKYQKIVIAKMGQNLKNHLSEIFFLTR